METAYQKVKVHNELEWCQVTDITTKEKIEKILLKNRVSYFVKWEVWHVYILRKPVAEGNCR